MKKLIFTFLWTIGSLATSFASAAEAPRLNPSFSVNGKTYNFDLPIDKTFVGKSGDLACGASVREGQTFIQIVSQPTSSYHDALVPDALLIDSLLKLRALTFMVDFVIPQDGGFALTAPHEKFDGKQLLDSDYLRSNNRLIFGILPGRPMEDAVKILKAPGLCSVANAHPKWLPRTQWNEAQKELIITCGNETSSLYTKLTLKFELSEKNYQLKSYDLQSELGKVVLVDGFRYRSTLERDVIHSISCQDMRLAQ